MQAWHRSTFVRGFCGRDWFFEKLEHWLTQPESRLLLVEAEPGWGKTALAHEAQRRLGSRLRVVDQVERLDRESLLQLLSSPQPVLAMARPHPRLSLLTGAGVEGLRFDSLDPNNLQDLARYLADSPGGEDILRRSAGNFGIAHLLLAQVSEVDIFRRLWQEAEDCLAQSPLRDLSSQILTLLGETGAALESWRFCDFLGASGERVRQALAPIEPLLRRQEDRYQVYSVWLGKAATWLHQRDLEVLHASIISYFRETYPSWEEMSDPYGWDHLVHHCDRLARSSRRTDFSVLHWLGEGPFLRQKLRQGGKLPGVLQDMERCLVAAMEEEDLSRIAFYSFQLARTLQERLAPEMHRLADMGRIREASHYALLIPRENHKLLALLLLAWQASEAEDFPLSDQLLGQATQVDSSGMQPEMNLLLVSLCACLLKSLPHRESDILALLNRDEHTGRAASNYLTLGLVEGLEDRLRSWVLRQGWSTAPHGSAPDQQRLSAFIGQSLRALKQFELAKVWSGTLARPALAQEEFDTRLKDLVTLENEVERLDQLVDLADVVSRQQPKEWLGHAVASLTQALQNFSQPESWLRGFAQLSRLWMTLGAIPEAFDGLERLTHLCEELALEPSLRLRIQADLALGFYRLADSSRAQQMITKAAAAAVGLEDAAQKCTALAFVAAATAQLNHPSRARDLAFTLLEALEPAPAAMQDHFCRLTFRLASSAHGSPAQMRQALGQDQRELVGLGNSPRERAYLLLGLARAAHHSGDADWAATLLQQAALQAHQLVVPRLQTWTLSDLACLAWDMGQHDRYRSFLEEAEEALGREQNPIHRLEGSIDICRALHHSKDRSARTRHRTILHELDQLPQVDVCLSPTLSRLWPLLTEAETQLAARQLLDKLRQVPELPPRDRDFYHSGLLHHELAFGEYERALAALSPLVSPQIRSSALVDVAVGLASRDPREGLQWLPAITRQPDRLRAIRLILATLGSEKRPWRQAACTQALQQLTLMAQEDEATVDLVVSYWLTREADRGKFEATGKRMNWTPEPAPMQPLIIPNVHA
jgi:hypothetical protein